MLRHHSTEDLLARVSLPVTMAEVARGMIFIRIFCIRGAARRGKVF
jgi:hypothetical protein